MAEKTQRRPVRVGDRLEVSGHRVGDAVRTGEIVEIVTSGGREHYRVRWEDDRETIVYPGSDSVVRRVRSRR